MRVERRWDHGGLEPKSKRGRRKREGDPITQNRRSDYARPWITQGHGPTTQRTRMDNDTGRNNNEYILMVTSKRKNRGVQPSMGHGLTTMNSRLRIANRAADRCRSLFASTQRTGNRLKVLPDVHGRSSKQRCREENRPRVESGLQGV